MHEDSLLAVLPRAFVVTTDSHQHLEVYHLASRMKPTGINQLWVTDITCIRPHREFVGVQSNHRQSKRTAEKVW
jgi:hypothetical protein